jgi:hypothetical protein
MKATKTTTTKKAPKTISIKAVTESMKKRKQTQPTADVAPEIVTTPELVKKEQNAIQAKRNELKELSRHLQKQAQDHGLKTSTNFLLREWYAADGHKELKTFEQWKEAGYFVRKGEKALLLWGHPKPSKQALTTATENGKTEEDAENDFYPIAYVFSNMQVKQISK